MSSHSLAALRKSAGDEFANLADHHFHSDLRAEDRDRLRTAAQRLSTHAMIGSIAGVGLGLLLASRARGARRRMFTAFRTAEKPTHVTYEGGRTEPLPDLITALRPSPLGDLFALFFFSAGGLFLGGETGLLTGSYAAHRTIASDPECLKRIETAFRAFRADVLRKEADMMDGGEGRGGKEEKGVLERIF
ncbi:hypothetical protein P152DRAFT_430082 [Eremomyces bilateralis CBS 781.70]|uniref:Uncharacterized protein n=1 Tax=Eremomyces bilateralis CBS 781.70 TaxID=1392243 RepID=A0A6G1GD49_9PEZI|nr:uncharacterized protein P152DRAFT_430082 [Eremomyces bilateralis CBS 781.70]KAF1815789.1 hypothetical protein P152DRAFT_430082 [Eremomyces bilateralis CBS 781.70]